MWRRMLLLNLCIAIDLTLIPIATGAITKRFVFQQQTGDKVTQYELCLTPHDGGYQVYGNFHDRTIFIECDESFVHQRFVIDRKAKEYEIRYERDGKTITGIIGDETITKTMSDAPWYQMLEISKAFIESKGNLGKFWMVSDQVAEHTEEPGFSTIELQAKGKGTEIIRYQGREVEAIKILVRLTGAMATFWKAEYWYRPADGVMLRYEGVRGLPGTPKTIITLLKEEEIPVQ